MKSVFLIGSVVVAGLEFLQIPKRSYFLNTPQNRIEIIGVCKFADSGAVCWGPNGDPSDEATKAGNQLLTKNDNGHSEIRLAFNRKNRLLLVKESPRTDEERPYPFNYTGGKYEANSGESDHWIHFCSREAVTWNSDQSFEKITHSLYVGKFSKQETQSSFRYQVTNFDSKKVDIPLRLGTFRVEGNTYSILKLTSDSSRATLVTIATKSIKNSNLTFQISPADESGEAYGGFDINGSPIVESEAQNRIYDTVQQSIKDQMAGKKSTWTPPMTVTKGYLDSNILIPTTIRFNVDRSKISRLSLLVGRRTVTVIESIKLDPK